MQAGNSYRRAYDSRTQPDSPHKAIHWTHLQTTAALKGKALRILILGLNYAPELTGIGKYTGEMAVWLSAQGHQVRVVTTPPYYPAWRIADAYRGRGYVREGGGPLGDGAGEPLVIRCPFYVPTVPSGLKRVLHLLSFAVSALPVMLREVLEQPDVIVTVEPALLAAPVALACGVLVGAPVWLHVQDFEVDAAFNLGLLPSHGPVRRLALEAERALTGAFHRVSTISMRMLQRLPGKAVAPGRAVLFPNWVDVSRIVPSVDDATNRFRRELGLADKLVLLYSGNMGGKQGLEMLPPLAAAFATEPRVHFVFCGDGAFRPQLETMVVGMANVTLLPLQPMDALNDLLNLADVHLLPQRADAADLVMPSKLTGMLSSGRATIVTAAQGTEVAGVVGGISGRHDACGLVVPPGDADALAAAVQLLLQDPALRLTLGRAARVYAERHLGTEQVLRAFETELAAAVTEYRNGLPA